MSSPDRGKGGGGVGSLCDKKYAYNKTFIDIFIFSMCCLLLKVVLDAVFINRAASICHHLPNPRFLVNPDKMWNISLSPCCCSIPAFQPPLNLQMSQTGCWYCLLFQRRYSLLDILVQLSTLKKKLLMSPNIESLQKHILLLNTY